MIMPDLVRPLPQSGCTAIAPLRAHYLRSFLLSTLDRDSYIRFGIWSAMCLTLYCLFSVHSIAYHHSHEQIPQYKCAPSSPLRL